MNNGKIIIYNKPDGEATVSVSLDNYTVWLSQQQIAELYGKEQTVIASHIPNVYKEIEIE